MLSNSLKQLTNYRVLLFKLLGTRQGMRQEFGSAIISQRGRFLYERFLYSGTAENNKHIRYCNIPYEHHVDSTADEVIWCSSEKWTIFCLAKKSRQEFWRECGSGGAWRGAVTAGCQTTRVTFLKRHRLSTARQSKQPKRRTDCARSQLAFFSSFLSSLVLPSLVLAQEPVEGAKSVLYSISEVYVAKDRIKIKVRDPIVNSNQIRKGYL